MNHSSRPASAGRCFTFSWKIKAIPFIISMPSIFISDHGRDVIHLTVFQKDLDLTHFSTFFLQIRVIIVDKLNQIVQSFILRMILLLRSHQIEILRRNV